MEYIFQLSAYNNPDLERQLSLALCKRTELHARRAHPRMWDVTDRLYSSKAPESVLRRRAILYPIYGIIMLIMGLFLLVPGLMDPKELFIPLLVGAFVMAMGVVLLLSKHKRNRLPKKVDRRFVQAAKKLLAGMQHFISPENEPISVRFSAEGMVLPDGTVATYNHIDTIVETDALYLLTWNEQVTVLQKQDLTRGEESEFHRYLEEKTGIQPTYVT